MSRDMNRPYTLSEDDHLALHQTLRAVRFIEYMSDEAKEGGTIEIELLSAVMYTLAAPLDKVMQSIDAASRERRAK